MVVSEICHVIGHSNPTISISRLDGDEKRLTEIYTESGVRRPAWVINKDGFYELLMTSTKPIAKRFKKCAKTLIKQLRKGELVVANPHILISLLALQTKKALEQQKKEIMLAVNAKMDLLSETMLPADDRPAIKAEAVQEFLAETRRSQGSEQPTKGTRSGKPLSSKFWGVFKRDDGLGDAKINVKKVGYRLGVFKTREAAAFIRNKAYRMLGITNKRIKWDYIIPPSDADFIEVQLQERLIDLRLMKVEGQESSLAANTPSVRNRIFAN